MIQRSTICLIATAILYALFRFWGLTDSCIWFDEIFSVHAATLPWNEVVPFAAKDLIHPPAFYLLLKFWILAFGESLIWLRILPVVLSVLALFPLWMLCRELKLQKPTVVAAFTLFAVNGALIKYAQEVRMYSLLLFLAIVSIWLFSRYFFRGKSFWMLVLTNAILVNTHYFGWFVVVSQVLAILIFQRIKILRTLLMLALTAVAFVPWVYALLRFSEPGSSVMQNIGWMKPPKLRALVEFAFDLVDPFYFQQSSVDAGANYLIAVPVLLLFVAAVITFATQIKDEATKERFYFLAVLAAAPVVLVFFLSWLMPLSIWGSRHLLIVFPPVLLLFAICLTELKPAVIRNIAVAAAGMLIMAAFVIYVRTEAANQIWCAWEGLAKEWIVAPQDSTKPKNLYVFEDLVAYHYWYATRGLPNYSVHLVKEIEGVRNDPAYFLPRGFDGVKVTDINGIANDEIWISFRGPARASKQGTAFIDDGFDTRFEVPVTNFENLGYSVEDVKRETIGTQTAYIIRMKKARQSNRADEFVIAN